MFQINHPNFQQFQTKNYCEMCLLRVSWVTWPSIERSLFSIDVELSQLLCNTKIISPFETWVVLSSQYITYPTQIWPQSILIRFAVCQAQELYCHIYQRFYIFPVKQYNPHHIFRDCFCYDFEGRFFTVTEGWINLS